MEMTELSEALRTGGLDTICSLLDTGADIDYVSPCGYTAMVDVMRPGGTALAAAAGASYVIAGKTGTAQVVGIKQGARYDAKRLSRQNIDHALFIAFAPADDPKIAIAVMVENGGHGGSTAAPIARAVMDFYLTGKRPGEVKMEVNTGAD